MSKMSPQNFSKILAKKPPLICNFSKAALLVIAKPYEIIQSGEVGIKVTAGKYDPIPLEPGIHFYIPGIQKIIKVDTKVRIITIKVKGTPLLEMLMRELLKSQQLPSLIQEDFQ